MATAIKPLANITLSSSASSVTFSSISGAYRDLRLVINAMSTTTVDSVYIRFNSDSTNTYTNVNMAGNGSATSSYAFTAPAVNITYSIALGTTGWAVFTSDILDYATTDKHKTVLSRASIPVATYPGTEATVSRWPSNAAITSITVTGSGSFSWASGSTFALYGVSA